MAAVIMADNGLPANSAVVTLRDSEFNRTTVRCRIEDVEEICRQYTDDDNQVSKVEYVRDILDGEMLRTNKSVMKSLAAELHSNNTVRADSPSDCTMIISVLNNMISLNPSGVSVDLRTLFVELQRQVYGS